MLNLSERWPPARRPAAVIYDRLDPRRFSTAAQMRFWARRHRRPGGDWGPGGADWIEAYWRSMCHPHRRFLLERIGAYSPLGSALEVGCNCGPNLFLLARKYPCARLTGIDVNKAAVERGNELLYQKNVANARLLTGRADDLSGFPDRGFDVVFSDAVLMYVGPDRVEASLREMLRAASRAVILLEQQDATSASGYYTGGKWRRDYISLVRTLAPSSRIEATPLNGSVWPDDGWARCGALIEVGL